MTRPRVKQWERLPSWERMPTEPRPEPETEPPLCFACGAAYVDAVGLGCLGCVADEIVCGDCRRERALALCNGLGMQCVMERDSETDDGCDD